MRQQRQKITIKDFEPIEIIGRGAFGEVRLCRTKRTNEVLAVKKMKKSEMLYKNQVAYNIKKGMPCKSRTRLTCCCR